MSGFGESFVIFGAVCKLKVLVWSITLVLVLNTANVINYPQVAFVQINTWDETS